MQQKMEVNGQLYQAGTRAKHLPQPSVWEGQSAQFYGSQLHLLLSRKDKSL